MTSWIEYLATQRDLWAKELPGHELDLARHLMHLLPGGKSLNLGFRKTNKWIWTFKRDLFWVNCTGVHFVTVADLCRDKCQYDVHETFHLSAWTEYTRCLIPRLQSKGCNPHQLREKVTRFCWDENQADLRFRWDMPGCLSGKYEWVRKISIECQTPIDMLDEGLESLITLACACLKADYYSEEAKSLLEILWSGNYPVGFDTDEKLLVLASDNRR